MGMKNVKIYHVGDKITPKQERWIDEYIKCDNLTDATIRAGYTCKNPRAMGYQNSVKFKELIDARRIELSKELTNSSIADLSEIFTFWTAIINDRAEETKDRLKASELLAKAKGGFIEKREVKVIDTDWFVGDNNG